MKQNILKTIMILCVGALAYMPNATAQRLSIGPMVGGNFTTITDVDNSKTIAGLNAGAFLNYSVNENLGFGLKGLFSQLGTAFESSNNEIRLNYIQIPLSVAYFFGERGNTIRPKVFIGPYVGFLLNAEDQNGNTINNHNYNSTDIGGQIGLGFNYSLKNRSWINFDAGYSRSLVNIADINNVDYKNSGFFVSLGYSFPIVGE